MFVYERTIHFPDTDAAGVVYFARFLSICHEAYEEALQAAGIPLREVFSKHGCHLPVRQCSADFLRPLLYGDRIRVEVRPKLIREDTFEIDFDLFQAEPPAKRVAVARTVHACIDPERRERVALPPAYRAWADAGRAAAVPAGGA